MSAAAAPAEPEVAEAPNLTIDHRTMHYIHECNYNIQYRVDEGSAEIIRELIDEVLNILEVDPENTNLLAAQTHLEDALYFAHKIETGRVYSCDILDMYTRQIRHYTDQAYELIRETVGVAD